MLHHWCHVCPTSVANVTILCCLALEISTSSMLLSCHKQLASVFWCQNMHGIPHQTCPHQTLQCSGWEMCECSTVSACTPMCANLVNHHVCRQFNLVCILHDRIFRLSMHILALEHGHWHLSGWRSTPGCHQWHQQPCVLKIEFKHILVQEHVCSLTWSVLLSQVAKRTGWVARLGQGIPGNIYSHCSLFVSVCSLVKRGRWWFKFKLCLAQPLNVLAII